MPLYSLSVVTAAALPRRMGHEALLHVGVTDTTKQTNAAYDMGSFGIGTASGTCV